MSFFEKTSDGPRYEGLISGVRGNGKPKLGRKIEEKGAKNRLQIFNTYFGLKVNVDYDFAIKHDPTQWFDQVMGVWSWVSKKGKKAWSYLKVFKMCYL